MSDSVVARRHVGDGDVVVLHDHASHNLLRIEPDQWRVLALADGTRDLEGITLAARARGMEVDAQDLGEFIEHLSDHGLLDFGPTEPPTPLSDPDADLLQVPLDAIDGWTFQCTGRGACCGVFPTVLFTEPEKHRALALLPQEEHDFLPQRGIARPGGAVATVLHDGQCRYLESGGRCLLHAHGGAQAKPRGCQDFPRQLVHDGEVVRVGCVSCPADLTHPRPS